MPFLRRGAIRDFYRIMTSSGLWKYGVWSKTERTYQFLNGSILEFFAADNPSKSLGSARDHLLINECNSIGYEIAFNLIARTTGRIWLDFNPRTEFWVHKELIQNKNFAGQFDFVHSTYKDNKLLSDQIISTMLSRAAKDENYMRVYIEGQLGSLEGLIFHDITLVDEIPIPQVYGLDWGYTNDPTAIVGVHINGDNLYLDEYVYQTGLRNVDIDKLMRQLGIGRTRPIYADSDPKSIDDLYYLGWNIHSTFKGKDSIIYGIELIKRYRIHVTKRSTGLIRELRNYTWRQDKNGILLNEPIDGYNHAIDAARYAVTMFVMKQQGYNYAPSIDYNTFTL